MKTLGVVAGFGPYAANYFIKRLLTLTDANKEWEQFPLIAYYNTQIPSRTRAVLYGEKSPAPKLIETIETLKKVGADLVAVPCNSSHGWYDEIARQIDIQWLDMIKVTSAAVKRRGIERALIISAYVPAKLKLYNDFLDNVVYLKEQEMNKVYKLIERLKINEDKQFIRKDLWKIIDKCDEEFDGIIIACTEPSMLFSSIDTFFGNYHLVDSTQEYAKRCVDICMEREK